MSEIDTTTGDYFAHVESALCAAAARRAHLPRYRRGLRLRPGTGGRLRQRTGSGGRLRVVLVGVALVFATTAAALAATGTLLTGSPVRTATRPVPTVGQGVPVPGGARLLPLRAADPAGGLPWGLRVVHTTRGLVCVQVGRVYDGRLGQLGIDGAFGDDGRFHALPADALPDVTRGSNGLSFENCAPPGQTYSGDIVGLEASAATNPPAGRGVPADRREVSFGLLGAHALTIAYHAGSGIHTSSVLPGLGAYLIVQRYSSGRQLGSISETDGYDQPHPYGGPASPNGALSAITYRYAGRVCTDTGSGPILRECGLSEVPPPKPAPLPSLRVPLRVHLQVHGHAVAGAVLSFPAPYPVTSAAQDYFAFARSCHRGGLSGGGSEADVARGAIVHIAMPYLFSRACGRTVTIEVDYVREHGGLPEPTVVGTATVHEPPGTHPAPLPFRPGGRTR